MAERTEGYGPRGSLGLGSRQVDSDIESDADSDSPLVSHVRQTKRHCPTRAYVSDDLEYQVGKVTDQLRHIVEEKAKEIRELKKATESLREDLESEKARYRVHKAKVRVGRAYRKAVMTKAKEACEEAARALDVSMVVKEEDSD